MEEIGGMRPAKFMLYRQGITKDLMERHHEMKNLREMVCAINQPSHILLLFKIQFYHNFKTFIPLAGVHQLIQSRSQQLVHKLIIDLCFVYFKTEL